MKKFFAMIMSALLLCGTTSMAYAVDAPAALAVDEINLGLVADEYIKGPHDMFCAPYDTPIPAYPEYGFDGDWSTTINYNVEGGEDYWFGVRFDQPTVLTYVMFIAPDRNADGTPDRVHCLHGCTLEGSNDGENWDFIIELGDNPDEFLEYMLDCEEGVIFTYGETPYDGESAWDNDASEPVAYTYYRVYNNCKGGAEWGDVELWGYFVETEPEYLPGDVNMDGVVDINDAMYLFQHSMLPLQFPITYPGAVDFEADGAIDIRDAMYLFQYSMLPDIFPIE